MTAAARLLAYAVQEDHENTGGFVFAAHSIVALRDGAARYGDGDISGWKARRAKWADQYAPGPVPDLAAIAQGWWFTCNNCECRIDSDGEDYDNVEPGQDVRLLEPVEDERGLFCDAACRDRYLVARAERKIYEQWMLDLLRVRLRDKLPGAVEIINPESLYPHVYLEERDGLWCLVSCTVAFDFPGRVHGAGMLTMDEKTPGAHVMVSHGDMPAWEKFWAELHPE